MRRHEIPHPNEVFLRIQVGTRVTQFQADLAEMRTQVGTRVAQFMEVITNLAHGQEELGDLVERPRVVQNENEHPEFMFEDIFMGQPRPSAIVNFPNQHANDYQNVTRNQGLHGNKGHFHHFHHLIMDHI